MFFDSLRGLHHELLKSPGERSGALSFLRTGHRNVIYDGIFVFGGCVAEPSGFGLKSSGFFISALAVLL